jgi:hypothetical protein
VRGKKLILEIIFVNLTPFIPLSTLGEGKIIRKEGRKPLLNSPLINFVLRLKYIPFYSGEF